MINFRFAGFLLVAACWCACGSIGMAQEVRATLGGRVLDAQGAMVPGAAVTVVSDDTSVEQRTRTNQQGNWVVEFLLPGHYHFSVAKEGFKTAERSAVELQAADSKQIDVQLQIARHRNR